MSPPAAPPAPAAPSATSPAARARAVLGSVVRALGLVVETDPRLLLGIGAAALASALLPTLIAVVGERLVDAVVAGAAGDGGARAAALRWVGVEGALVVVLTAAGRLDQTARSLLRARLGHRVNVRILEKAQQFDIVQFEDPAVMDRLTRARRGASTRPLNLVTRGVGAGRAVLSLLASGAVLLAHSPLAVLLLAASAAPAFVAETRFADLGFRLFSWRSQDRRMQDYIEVVASREDHAKEVKLLGLGPMLLGRYDAIFQRVYAEEAGLVRRRGLWGWGLGLLSTGALYATYAGAVLATLDGQLTLGQMTLVLLLFKQGQSTFHGLLMDLGGIYEDHLYLSTLDELLATPTPAPTGGAAAGPAPGDGVRFESVGFTYPGAAAPALQGVSLHLPPGRKLALVGHNGSGKTTLIKLMTGLYTPTEGRVLLDGLDLRAWDPAALRARVGVIFQDFVRYQFSVGDNVGVGDLAHIDDEGRRARAAEKGMAAPFIEALPRGYQTQLGRWFEGGRELSGGQWQKIALARAFMREGADVLVLDEPTSAMDAAAEAEIFDRVRQLADDKLAVLISHRFSTVRMADEIVVLDGGRVVEHGDHEGLMTQGGRYAHLFALQARGYQ